MTEQQQKLYDKLLKKVNEFCLGAAAEDVIAAIDALVENYETPKVDPASKPLEVWYLVKKYLNLYHHQAISEKIDVETVEGHPISIIEDSLKALQIIKDKLEPYVDKYRDLGYTIACNMIAIGIPQEEYEILKEVLK
jgi:hypothetical protein